VNVVYSASLVTNHSVTLNGLLPNRVYHYAVVSRDLAGNTMVDDHNGNYYTFQTLAAPKPPWFDNLEGDTSGWKVMPDPATGSDINWTLGTPNNGLTTSAHSGTNAWGGNLNGDQNFTGVRTFLYAPIIDLTGLKSATLTFSNVYDFTRTVSVFGYDFYVEDGGVFVSTKDSVPPSINLPLGLDYADTAAYTWQQQTVDLSQFCGQTIRVVFYYEANAVGEPAYGWTIDDIRITGVVAGGDITITKNLGQGAWSLASVSPIGDVPVQSGVAPSITLSNLPAGNYRVQFGDVPHYLTPPDQTNALALNGALNFTGTYAMIDVNSNGIADSWERDHFGSVSTNRTTKTDTDLDGMTDYAEFIAGTNPTNAASRLYFTSATLLSNQLVQIQWPVVSNRLYQVNASTNLAAWLPVMPWQQATNSAAMNFTGTNVGRAQYFRVQVQP
jgi:hypothetical protein